jgi:stage IV sporulation protein FB
MLRIPGKIPIAISPAFWIFAALIGYLNSQSFIGTIIWIGIIFVSVLVHEFGHALTAAAPSCPAPRWRPIAAHCAGSHL